MLSLFLFHAMMQKQHQYVKHYSIVYVKAPHARVRRQTRSVSYEACISAAVKLISERPAHPALSDCRLGFGTKNCLRAQRGLEIVAVLFEP